MNKSIAYGFVTVVVLAFIAVLGLAQISSVYDPIQKRNVPIDRVSMDQLKAWAGSPAFSKWTNMDGLQEYLSDKGISLEELREDSRNLDRREMLSLQGRKGIVREYTARTGGEKAVTDIDCDVDDAELEFELTNIGNKNWYLVDQTLSTGARDGRKLMSDAHTQAKEVKLYVNNFLVNSHTSKYWMGEKLFYPEGETFADACGADFLRTGRTVDCKLKPIHMASSAALQNTYRLLGPGFSESGTFKCTH